MNGIESDGLPEPGGSNSTPGDDTATIVPNMRSSLRVLLVIALPLASLISVAGAVAGAWLVAEEDVAKGKWFIHYAVYALPGAVLGVCALLALSLATCSRGVRRSLAAVALIGLAPALIGVGWLLLR